MSNPTQSSATLVSVVIPLYNHEKYVAKCLDSVVGSRYRPLEIVVLDDGSTDNSLAVAEAWARQQREPEVTVNISHQANQGIAKTLNRLVLMARGGFVAIVASDDYLLPEGIGARIEALQRSPHWLAVFGDSIVVDETDKRIHDSWLDSVKTSKRALLHHRHIAGELVVRWGIPGGSLMVRREAFDPFQGVGLYDETLPFEDRDFCLRVLARGSMGFIDRPVSAYRQHSANSFKAKDAKRLADYAYGLYLSELKNALKFKGSTRLALRISARRALDDYHGFKGLPGLNRLAKAALLNSLRLLRRWHRLRVWWTFLVGDGKEPLG